jgi:hypothetical protein
VGSNRALIACYPGIGRSAVSSRLAVNRARAA